jgi:hypothetical protein
MKSIHLLLLSVFLIPLMQSAYAQSTMNQSGSPIVNQPAGTDNPVNKPGDRFGLIEDTPNYNKYIPNTGPDSNNALIGPAQPSDNSGGGGNGSSNTATSSNASSNNSGGGGNDTSNTANPIGGALANTTKSVGEALGKGISSIMNLGNNSAK